MPIIKSAKKRVKIARVAKARNVKTKRAMREALKAVSTAISSGKAANIAKAQAEAMSTIDKAAKKNVIHKNNAARKKARVASMIKASGVKPAKAATAPKAATKKPITKKTTKVSSKTK